MLTRSVLTACLLGASCLVAPTACAEDPATRTEALQTQWSVRGAAGLDAILFVGMLSGDVLQSHYYPEEIAEFRSRLPQAALDALARIDQRMRVEAGGLAGPSLVYLFSAAPFETMDDVIATARDPEQFVRPNIDQLISWHDGDYEEKVVNLPDVLLVLEALREAEFEAWYAENYTAEIEAGVAATRAAVTPYDIIPEQARLLGRALDPMIEIRIVAFSLPYGIRIAGQRFMAHYSYPADIQLRVAAHEIFHPPFNLADEGLRASLAPLAQDPWMRSIVENHDPARGYNSFEGLMNEGSTQALDQIVSERLGFAREPGPRWGDHDGGMHMLAAALYHAMKEDGFDVSGGRYEDWLRSAIARGMLAPDEVRRRARAIVGDAPVQYWYDVMETVE